MLRGALELANYGNFSWSDAGRSGDFGAVARHAVEFACRTVNSMASVRETQISNAKLADDERHAALGSNPGRGLTRLARTHGICCAVTPAFEAYRALRTVDSQARGSADTARPSNSGWQGRP